jgi:glycosyltransferase involved in cell wall biosynthesis
MVVDDCSTDATPIIAKSAGATVIKLAKNQGKGNALNAGIDAISKSDSLPEAILLLDGDLGDSAKDGELLLHALFEQKADIAIAILPSPAGSGGFGLVKRLATKAIRTAPGIGANEPGFPQAPLSGQRAIRFDALPHILPLASGFGVEVVMTIRALAAGLKIVEVQTAITHAATGRDLRGFYHRGCQYFDIRRALARLKRELKQRSPKKADGKPGEYQNRNI